MPATKASTPPAYTIFIDGGTKRGTARDLLEAIRADAATRSDEIAKMDADRYASSIVKDADFFLDNDFLKYLEREEYATKYDRALRYLSEMASSGVRILTRSST